MRGRRRQEPDVPTQYNYAAIPEQPVSRPEPVGIECADSAGDPYRAIYSAYKRCGHSMCAIDAPCDICRVTIRLRALENPS